MTAGAQNIKKETVNESQSWGQNNGGQTRQRFTGGDMQTAQRKTLDGIRHQAGANENPERPQDSQAGAGLERKADKPKCGQGRRPTAPQASPPTASLRPRRRGAKQGSCSRKRSGNFSSSETDASALGHVTRHFHAWVSAYPGEMEMRVHTKRT